MLCVCGSVDIVSGDLLLVLSTNLKKEKWRTKRNLTIVLPFGKVRISESFRGSPIHVWSPLATLLEGLIMLKMCGIYWRKGTTQLILLNSNSSLHNFIKCEGNRLVYYGFLFSDELPLGSTFEPELTTLGDVKKFVTYRDGMYLIIQFLMAIRDDFEGAQASLLNHSPFPSLDIVLSKLISEEIRFSTRKLPISEPVWLLLLLPKSGHIGHTALSQGILVILSSAIFVRSGVIKPTSAENASRRLLLQLTQNLQRVYPWSRLFHCISLSS